MEQPDEEPQTLYFQSLAGGRRGITCPFFRRRAHYVGIYLAIDLGGADSIEAPPVILMRGPAPEIETVHEEEIMETVQTFEFATIEQARGAFAQAKQGWRDAQQIESEVRNKRRYSMIPIETLCVYTETAYAAMQALEARIIAQFGKPNPEAPECKSCLQQSVFPGGPRHQASARCRSGRRPHCSCDTCF